QENQSLKRLLFCHICGEQLANCMFIPCHHLVTCENCGSLCSECHKCFMKIEGHLKIYTT
ncbi:hypothetical protein CAPTEDRAFT_130840, partial [Capitella teleta]